MRRFIVAAAMFALVLGVLAAPSYLTRAQDTGTPTAAECAVVDGTPGLGTPDAASPAPTGSDEIGGTPGAVETDGQDASPVASPAGTDACATPTS